MAVLAGQIVKASDFPQTWTSYTPAWSSSGTQPTLGNGTSAGEYFQTEKLVFVRGIITFGSTTTFGTGNYAISVPVTPDVGLPNCPYFGCWYRDTSPANDYQMFALLNAGSNFQLRGAGAAYPSNAVWSATTPVVPASGDWVSWGFAYKAA